MSVLPYSIFDPPPEVVDPVVSLYFDHVELSFSWPKLRSATLYGAATWTNNNTGSYTAAKINDGDLTTTAFTAATAGDGSVNADFGAPIQIREFWVYYSAIAGGVEFTPEWSTDNVNWFIPAWYNQTNTGRTVSGKTLCIYTIPAAVGAKRYWRLRKSIASNTGTTVVEAWPRTYGELYGPVDGFRVYSLAGFFGGGLPIANVTFRNIPTATNPMWLPPTVTPFQTLNGAGSQLSVSVMSSNQQAESYGHYATSVGQYGSTQDLYDRRAIQQLTLVNGLNSDIATVPGRGLIEISGPTLAFSVGGFTFGSLGERVRLYNTTAQAMTIVHEDAASVAANRINIFKAANLVLAAGKSYAELQYSFTTGRFMLTSAYDNTGPK